MVLWLNGTSGSGQTTTALDLPLIASSRLFDPETKMQATFVPELP
jgi:adenylylsulfate kinase-like enzyme